MEILLLIACTFTGWQLAKPINAAVMAFIDNRAAVKPAARNNGRATFSRA